MKNGFWLTSLALAVAPATSAQAAQTLSDAPMTLGPRDDFYVKCTWMSGPSERTVTQIEKIEWRDGIRQFNGRTYNSPSVPDYFQAIHRQVHALLGPKKGFSCLLERDRDDMAFQAGTTVETKWGPVSIVEQRIDPNWLFFNEYSKNMQITSLGARAKAPAMMPPKRAAPATRPEKAVIDLVGGQEEKARQAALTKARLDNMRAYEQQQVQGLVTARKNDAADKAALDKLKTYLRERGRKQ